MRITLICILLIFSLKIVGQHIDGPANIREKPNGEILYSINDYVLIYLVENQAVNNWHKILLNCYVLPDRLINKKVIKGSTTLLDYNGDSIGFTTTQFELTENHNEKYWKYDELEKIEITLSGYTYKTNIRSKIDEKEIIENKLHYTDTCLNRYLTYQEENGSFITLQEKCDLYSTTLLIDNKYQNVFVKEKQIIKRLSGAEGQESQIDLEIILNYLSDLPVIKKFSVDADAIEINRKFIKSVKYGCCGGEDVYQLFNSITFNKLMEYTSSLYRLTIPNSKVEGYIGYQPSSYAGETGVVGSLVFSDGESLINKINFVTNDKSKFKNILRFTPDMEFLPTNNQDKVRDNGFELELWSKNFSKSNKDLTGFKFIIHLIDDSSGNEVIQELEIINGYINGNPQREFDIKID